jgi:putative endonuclease
VLKSKKDRQLYIGYTSNLKERLKQHNEGKTYSTRQRIPFTLAYYEAFSAQKDALIREKQLKQFKSAYSQLKKRIANSLNDNEARDLKDGGK